MARHDQRSRAESWVCDECKVGCCNACIDVLRAVYSNKPLCRCTREGHDGEPRRTQILDPETGTVHAPGLEVTTDGEVKK